MSEKLLKVVREFDPVNDEHVQWLKRMTRAEPRGYLDTLRSNPLGTDFDSGDIMYWAQLHMCLCAKYVKHLFSR